MNATRGKKMEPVSPPGRSEGGEGESFKFQ